MGRVFAISCLIVVLSTYEVRADVEACTAATQPKILTDPTGTFASLNFPSNYPDNVDCQWLIVAQPDEVVNIDFTTFDTERRFDTVWFLDGNSTLSAVIQGLDGTYATAPTSIASSQRFLYVWFQSDANTNAVGFSANYQSTDPAGIQNACSSVSRPLILSAYSGIFSSAYYPDPYPLQCECQWLIVSQEAGGIVQLDFTFFITEANSDWFIAYDGNSQSGQIIARLSGQYTPDPPTNIRSTQEYMFVRFSSSARLSARGFRAVYTSIPAGKK